MEATTFDPISMTFSDAAAGKVKALIEEEENEHLKLRVFVTGGGCSGLTYTLSLESQPQETDKIIDEHDVRLFVDKKGYIFLAGTTLDYSDGLNGKGFVFNNPNAKTTCGCGTSFSV